MFKKIEIWVLYLTVLLGFVFAVSFGVLVRQELVGTTKAGWVSKSALTLAEIPMHIKKLLQGNEHLILEDRYPNIEGGFIGQPNTQESYLLLSRYDVDLAEGIVELVDLQNFETLHTWNPDFDAFNALIEKVAEFEYLSRDNSDLRALLLHPKLTEDGGVLFSWSGPLRKIDACSDLVFQNTHDLVHHSIETDIEGNIWAMTYKYPQSFPENKVGRGLNFEEGFLDDTIVKFSPSGEVLFEKSVPEIFIENGMEYLLFSVGVMEFNNDPIHLNNVEPVNFDSKYWKKGDVFLSIRNQSMVMLYRPSSNQIIWQGTGHFFYQHDVNILDDHRISIFNNNAKNFASGTIVDENSEVLIYDFATDEYSSYLADSLQDLGVKTFIIGQSDILQNGDLFIDESMSGRLFYFNADGSLRWSYLNRVTDGDVHSLAWPRIVHKPRDVSVVKKFLNSKGKCNV